MKYSETAVELCEPLSLDCRNPTVDRLAGYHQMTHLIITGKTSHGSQSTFLDGLHTQGLGQNQAFMGKTPIGKRRYGHFSYIYHFNRNQVMAWAILN